MQLSYVISRNATGRPTLMHKMELPGTWTICGINTAGWSKAYMPHPITAMLCRKCGRVS